MIISTHKISFYKIGIAVLLCASSLHAQAPIDIERKTAGGEYMVALTMYDRMPKRVLTPLSIIAAAKSAWALGLSERALAEYDTVIRSEKLSVLELSRVNFAKAAIFLQQQKYQLAVLSVDEALSKLQNPSPLRGAMLMLKAQALAAQNLYPGAVEILLRAQSEIGDESQIEFNYLLGKNLTQVGRYAEAKDVLRKIPSTHERAPDGIRELIHISDAEGDYKKAAMWVTKGRESYPDSFLDSWCDYLLVQGAIAADNGSADAREEIKLLKQTALKRLAPSDSWLALIIAAVEQHSWANGQAISQAGLLRNNGGQHE